MPARITLDRSGIMPELTDDERRPFLAAIRAAPEDDLPRLVYADWCDENGQPERAEFIRVQVEIHRRRQSPAGLVPLDSPHLRYDVESQRHLKRERELWMPPSAAHAAIIRDLPAGYSATPEPWLAGSPHAIVRRGFVAEIRCTLADWCGCPECGGEPPRQVASGPVRLTFGGGATVSATNVTRACGACRGRGQAIGPEVVRRHPVERVILSDLKPTRDTWDSTYRWVIDIPAARADGDENNLCLLPEAVWKLLPGWNGKTLHARSYATREDAMFAASTALILWAKGTK